MRLRSHFDLEGRHATLSPSQYHWVNYSDDKMMRVYREKRNAARGDRLHAIAAALIRDRIRLPEEPKTLNLFVNESIGWRMNPEQPVFYSDWAFGTADALSFRNNLLRISDLKTGLHEAKVTQLEVYAAYFCLEYDFMPTELEIELRIYQNNDVRVYEGDPVEIMRIMDRAVTFTKMFIDYREEPSE